MAACRRRGTRGDDFERNAPLDRDRFGPARSRPGVGGDLHSPRRVSQPRRSGSGLCDRIGCAFASTPISPRLARSSLSAVAECSRRSIRGGIIAGRLPSPEPPHTGCDGVWRSRLFRNQRHSHSARAPAASSNKGPESLRLGLFPNFLMVICPPVVGFFQAPEELSIPATMTLCASRYSGPLDSSARN